MFAERRLMRGVKSKPRSAGTAGTRLSRAQRLLQAGSCRWQSAPEGQQCAQSRPRSNYGSRLTAATKIWPLDDRCRRCRSLSSVQAE